MSENWVPGTELQPIDRVQVTGAEADDGDRIVAIRLTLRDGQVTEGYISIATARGLSTAFDEVARTIDPASQN